MRHLPGPTGLLGADTASQDGGLEIHSVAHILYVHDSFRGSQYMVFNLPFVSDFAYGLLLRLVVTWMQRWVTIPKPCQATGVARTPQEVVIGGVSTREGGERQHSHRQPKLLQLTTARPAQKVPGQSPSSCSQAQ